MNSLRSGLIYIVIILLFLSCEKEGVVVHSSPLVQILSTPEIANGIITIEVLVDNTTQAAQLDYYLDSELLKQESPIGDKKTSFDTRSFSDGPHTFKVTLTDKSGRQSTDELTLTIKNTVVTIATSANYLSSTEDSVFVFASDKDGKTVAKGSAKNGKRVSLIALHHFDTDPVMLTVYRYDPEVGYRVMNSFYPVTYGSTFQLVRPGSSGGDPQFAYIDVQNIPQEFDRLHLSSMKTEHTNINEMSIAFLNPFGLEVNGTEPDSVLAIMDGKNSARFNMIRNLSPANFYPLDLSSSDFVRSDNHFTISFAETIPTWGFATLYGHPHESRIDDKMVLGVGRATQFEDKIDLYYYPQAEQQFKSFSIRLSGDFAEEMIVAGVRSLAEMPHTYKSLKVDAHYIYSINPDSIKVVLRPRRGTIASHVSRFNSYNTYWSVYQSGSELTVALPDLPEELTKEPHNLRAEHFDYQITDCYGYDRSTFETVITQVLKEDYEYEYSLFDDPVFQLSNPALFKAYANRVSEEGRGRSRQNSTNSTSKITRHRHAKAN